MFCRLLSIYLIIKSFSYIENIFSLINFRLDTSSLARGELNGVKYSAELTAADCFELGRQSYNNGDYYHTQLWMKEAEERLKREANETVDLSDVLEYLAFSTYKEGMFDVMKQEDRKF